MNDISDYEMIVSCYLIADVKTGKVLLTSVKALTSFADLCQTSRSWIKSFNTECCSIEDKKKKMSTYIVEYPSLTCWIQDCRLLSIGCNELQKSTLCLLDSELHWM